VKKLITITSIFLIFLYTNISCAEGTGYEVEIIIFSYLNDKYEISENWPENRVNNNTEIVHLKQEPEMKENSLPKTMPVESLNTTKSLIVDNSTNILDEKIKKPIDLNIEADFLSPEHYRMTREANRIKKNPNYNFLMHMAWKQAGLPNEKAFFIHLDNMKVTTDDLQTLNQQDKVSLLLDSTDVIDKQDVTEYIGGEIKLVMSRYLHISSKLILHKFNQQMAESNTSLEPSERVYKINLDRRMKSKEINFIDHPLVGILVIATPFVIPDEEHDSLETIPTYKTIN